MAISMYPDVPESGWFLINFSLLLPSYTHIEGRTLEKQVDVLALIALRSTDLLRITSIRRRGGETEILTLKKTLESNMRPLLCVKGVSLVSKSYASSYKFCFWIVAPWFKACFSLPSGAFLVSLGHAENRSLFKMLTWIRGWWKVEGNKLKKDKVLSLVRSVE